MVCSGGNNSNTAHFEVWPRSSSVQHSAVAMCRTVKISDSLSHNMSISNNWVGGIIFPNWIAGSDGAFHGIMNECWARWLEIGQSTKHDEDWWAVQILLHSTLLFHGGNCAQNLMVSGTMENWKKWAIGGQGMYTNIDWHYFKGGTDGSWKIFRLIGCKQSWLHLAKVMYIYRVCSSKLLIRVRGFALSVHSTLG